MSWKILAIWLCILNHRQVRSVYCGWLVIGSSWEGVVGTKKRSHSLAWGKQTEQGNENEIERAEVNTWHTRIILQRHSTPVMTPAISLYCNCITSVAMVQLRAHCSYLLTFTIQSWSRTAQKNTDFLNFYWQNQCCLQFKKMHNVLCKACISVTLLKTFKMIDCDYLNSL